MYAKCTYTFNLRRQQLQLHCLIAESYICFRHDMTFSYQLSLNMQMPNYPILFWAMLMCDKTKTVLVSVGGIWHQHLASVGDYNTKAY